MKLYTRHREPKLKRAGELIRETAAMKLRAFCKHFTLHGFYYFSEIRHWTVYATWSTIILGSFALCVFLSNMIWLKYIVDPTFTVVETTHYSIAKIPFPAVTVCDTDPIFGPSTDNITNILHQRSFDQKQIAAFYKSFSDVMKRDYNPPEYLKKMHKALQDLGYSYNELLEMFSKPCDVLITHCTWRSEAHNCTHMFRKEYTVAGYCCKFDMQYFKEHVDPATNFVPGVETTDALRIVVDGQKITFTDEVSSGYVSLYIYDDTTHITVTDTPATLTPGGLFDVNVIVWAIESSQDVRMLTANERKCFLQDEQNGNVFYQECMSMHIIRNAVSICRCLPFKYSAKSLGVEEYSNCTWDRLTCFYKALEKTKSNIKDIVYQNDCLQRCDYVQYTTKIDYIRYHRDVVGAEKLGLNHSDVVVHPASKTCMKYQREVIYSWDQMLANLGGIFGLCLGGSIISLVEIIWFIADFIFTLFKDPGNGRVEPKKTHVFSLTHKELTTNGSNKENIRVYRFVK